MDNINYRGIPTSLFLNGPKLGIVTDPQSQTDVIGVATFTGIATASFPNPTDGVNDGSIAFKWYYDGSQILDTSVDSNSNASIVGFNSATGTGSTITINGLTTDDSNKEVYFTADYIPSAYSQPAGSAVTAGTARSTGNSFNEPLQSGIGTITVFPIIEITSQPTDQIVGQTFEAEYSIAAKTTPGDGPVEYQWQLNGNDLSDGTNTTSIINESATGQITITNDTNSTVETIDFSQVSSYDSFAAGVTYNLTANADITTKVFATGAGGGSSRGRSVSGGAGGESTGTFTFVNGQTYKLNVGQSGVNAGPGGFSGGGNGGGGEGLGGGGGGYTGLFSDSITIGNSVIIAGGGGGGANDPAGGGAGGGLTGGDAGNAPGRGGEGGTQSAGGGGGQDNGAALQGGPGAAGGGGGYYGGAGGNPFPSCCADGAGGGGSGYIGGVTDGTTTTGAGAKAAQDGSFSITRVSSTKTVVTTVSGAGTNNLKIFTDDQDFGGSLKCTMTSSGVTNSPLDSQTVSYDVIPPRIILNFEAYDIDNNIKTSRQDLNLTGSFAVTSSTFGSQYSIIQFTSVEKDSSLTLEMKASAGANNGTNIGGAGGVSSINVKVKRNVEYTLIGVSNNSAVFLYEKSSLVAVVGEGGNAGTGGNGGSGGGINVAGQEGSGVGNGIGGEVPTLNLTGIFGSVVNDYSTKPNLYNGDTIAEVPDAGRTVICTKGRYYVDQGINPCSDISTGEMQFRSIDGTLIAESSSLYRGFKPGYTVTATEGKTLTTGGGNGGAGAQGGSGTQTGSGGGGGGSGWTNRVTSIVNSQLGGNTTKLSSVIFNPNENSLYYVDPYGRILIMAWSPTTPTNALPFERQEPVGSTLRYMNKITGKVLPTDGQNCIDDARWRAILDKARDGTQDWRLTATGWNNPRYLLNASPFNLKMMIDANVWPLESNARQPASLTSWLQRSPSSTEFALAWDENDGADATGGDYSLLWYVQGSDAIAQTGNYGFGYYNHSSNPFFDTTKIYIRSANWWILPPGVPDFTTASPIFSPDQGNRDAPDNGINIPGA